MALLSNESKTNIAFKKLVGKAHTGNLTDFFAESIPSQVSINLQEVIGDEIPTDPQQAVNDGVVEFVELELEEITASNDLAFNLVFPDGRLAPTYSGFFTSEGASGGDLVRNYTQIVSQKNNLSGPVQSDNSGGYVYRLKDQNGNQISLGAQEGWQLDPVAGVVTSQDPISELQVGSGAGGTVELYVYTGRFLDETLNDISSGSGFTGTTNDVPEPTGATRTSGDNIYFTNERVDDRLSEVFTDGSNVDSSYDDANDTFTVNVPDAQIQDAVFNNVLDAVQQDLISVSYNDTNNVVSYSVNANLSNYTNDAGFLVGVDINDGGTDIVPDADTLNFGTGVSVVDDGNGQVTINASSALSVDDSGTNVVSEAGKLNFDSRINASQDGSNPDQVNVSADADLSLYDNTQNWISGIDVDDGGTGVNTDITTFNFGNKLSVTDDGSGQVTISGNGLTSNEFETELETVLVGGTGITVDTTTASETQISAHQQNTDTGTTSQTFLLNSGAATSAQVILKSLDDGTDGGELQVRNSGDSSFRDLRVRNLDVTGTETVNNTTTISVSDNEIVLNDSLTDTDSPFSGESGVRVNRGSESDAVFEWSESNGYWQVGTDPDDSPAGTLNEVLAAGKNVSLLNIDITTDDLPEGTTNFYFTASDAKEAVFGTFNGAGGVLADAANDQTLITVEYDTDGNQQVKYAVESDLSQYDNSTTGFVGSLGSVGGSLVSGNAETLSSANYTTNDLPEGSSNLYFTDNRAQTAVANALTTNTATAIDISTSGGNSTIAVDHGNTGGAADNSDTGTVINQITFDSFGHVESVGDTEANLNELQKLLPSAPTLSNAGADASSQGEDGALSFDSSNDLSGSVEPVPGTNRNDVFTFSGVNADGSFNENFGVVGNNDSGTNIVLSGPLNPQVDANDQHDADIFGQATVGRLDLIVNQGTTDEVSVTLNLSATESSVTSDNANGTGISVSQAEPLDFPNNNETFDGIKQRSGTWTIDQSDLRSGYNEVLIRHRDGSGSFGSPGTVIGTTQIIKYVLDDDADVIGFPNAATFTNLTFDGVKNISGVAYHTGAQADYEVSISNVYKNTYSPDSGAIEFPSGLQSNVSVPNQPIPELQSGDGVNKTINVPIDLSITTLTADVTADRLIGESIAAQAQVFDPVDLESPQTDENAEASGFDLLVDQVSSGNSALEHNWNDENYRIESNLNFDSDLALSINWDSTNSLKDSGAASDPGPNGYNDGLQVIDGQIEYPRPLDFSQNGIANAPTGSGLASNDNPDYSTDVSGIRYLYAGFTDSTGTSNFTLSINGSGTLISEDQSFSVGSDQVKVSIKLPGLTGWLDVNKDFATGQVSDGDGAFFESNGSNQSIGPSSEIGLTTGEQNTSNSFDKLFYRITVPENWSGNITNVSIDWGATS